MRLFRVYPLRTMPKVCKLRHMATRTAYTVNSADLIEMLSYTGYPWNPDRNGVMCLTLADEDYTLRVTEDDGTFKLTALVGRSCALIHTEASFSGVAAQVALLATIDALVDELA